MAPPQYDELYREFLEKIEDMPLDELTYALVQYFIYPVIFMSLVCCIIKIFEFLLFLAKKLFERE